MEFAQTVCSYVVADTTQLKIAGKVEAGHAKGKESSAYSSYLSNVMADIIDEVHVQVIRSGLEHLGKGLAHQEGHGGPIHPGKVGSACHGLQIVLALLGVDACACKLPVIGVNVVTCHSPLHGCQSICCHLQQCNERVQAYTGLLGLNTCC